MLSRVTHAVLLLAVIVLSIALVRATRHAPAVESAIGTQGDVKVVSDDVLRDTAAAFAPFDPSELEFADPSSLTWAGEMNHGGAQSPPQDAGMPGDSSREHASNRGGGGRGGPDHGMGGGGRPPFDGRDGGRDGDRSWGGGGPGGPGGMPRLTEELTARCLEIASEVDPELAKRLIEARDKNPDEFERQMRAGGFGRRLLGLAQLKTRDPILYGQKLSELSSAVQIERTAKQLREARKNPSASLGKVEELESNLRSLLQLQLAMSIKARGDMLCRFDERRLEMEKDLAREAANFQSTIDARMNMLTAEPTANPKRDDAKPGEQAPINATPAVSHN